MSTFVEVRYPLGRVHANPWDRHPNEGVAEWPPSPWRLLRALYAVWRERVPDLDADAVHRALTSLAAELPTYWVPPSAAAHSRHWYPTTRHRSDPAGYDKSLALDGFVALECDQPLLIEWPVDLDESERRVLDRLLSLLTYLGRSESVVDARRVDGPGPRPHSRHCAPLAPGSDDLATEPTLLLAPTAPLDIGALAVSTAEMQRLRLNLPPRTRCVAYGSPFAEARARAAPTRPRRLPVTAVQWRLTAPALPSVRAAIAQGDALRTQLLQRYGSRHDGRHTPTLSGRDPHRKALKDDHAHAHYLHYDLDGDGLLEVAVLWAPGGLDDDELRIATGLRHVPAVDREGAADLRAVSLGLEYVGPAEGLSVNIIGPARRWTSLTPFAPVHYPKRRERDDWPGFVRRQVEMSLKRLALPQPTRITVRADQPWLQHRRHRLKERMRHARRAVGVMIEFPAEVPGPVAIGGLSHFGLGLMLPDLGWPS